MQVFEDSGKSQHKTINDEMPDAVEKRNEVIRMSKGFNLYDFFNTAICGVIIGAAGIIPGLSGAVIAVSLGIYPKLISAITDLRKNFKKTAPFLITFALSALLGMFLFGVVMKPLLDNYEHSIIWLFMGLIIGSIPSFMKEATQEGFKITYIIPMIIFFATGMFLTDWTGYKMTVSTASPVMMFAVGAILAIGAVVPGISSSFILMQIGMYDKLISAFVGFELLTMFWVALGGVIFLLATVKLINLAFKRLYGYAHFAAFGFLLSTMVGVFPRIEHITDIVLFIVGAVFIYTFDIVIKNNTAAK